ncbi:hypothetical protein JTE90_029334 [Oedothorax gibbosus]|uniref:Protein transport protein Sec61 subunit gamma n=1 Tax=Oedothorax gibbosus TaxID=931172 RepID=A0AAV6UJ13_9ARAC|nr:hypothetical protein JTE90_029334 [Oedothorax gibbosus]
MHEFLELLLTLLLQFFYREVKEPLMSFFLKCMQFWRRCSKPDSREFSKIANATLIGAIMMGSMGFFVKLIFIPVNHILMASPAENAKYGFE